MIVGVGISALARQRGQFVHGQLRRGLRFIARHVRLRQLAFGLPQFELGVDARGDAASRDGDDVFALRSRALGDVGQGVFAIQLDIGLCDRRAEQSFAFSTSSSAEWLSACALCTALACFPKKSRSHPRVAPAWPIQKVCPASGGGMR